MFSAVLHEYLSYSCTKKTVPRTDRTKNSFCKNTLRVILFHRSPFQYGKVAAFLRRPCEQTHSHVSAQAQYHRHKPLGYFCSENVCNFLFNSTKILLSCQSVSNSPLFSPPIAHAECLELLRVDFEEVVLLETPAPVEPDGARGVHACALVEPEDVLHGDDRHAGT